MHLTPLVASFFILHCSRWRFSGRAFLVQQLRPGWRCEVQRKVPRAADDSIPRDRGGGGYLASDPLSRRLRRVYLAEREGGTFGLSGGRELGLHAATVQR